MGVNVWVKVVGFNDVERHSLNTIIRLSERSAVSYLLWTPDSPASPQVALIDMDSYEASLELASPTRNPNLKLICVGANAPETAWRSLQRPVDWSALVREMDGLFSLQPDLDIDLGFGDTAADKLLPPGVKVTLLVGMTREERLYLRSRLALAGLTEVDEAVTAGESIALISQRNYALAIISNELDDADPWSLVQALQNLATPVRTVMIATHFPSWAVEQEAERAGCSGLIEIPFDPRQVYEMLQKI
jgi:CheY-like chemotaxis protein